MDGRAEIFKIHVYGESTDEAKLIGSGHQKNTYAGSFKFN